MARRPERQGACTQLTATSMNYTPTSVKQLEEAFAANPNAEFKLKIYSGTFGLCVYACPSEGGPVPARRPPNPRQFSVPAEPLANLVCPQTRSMALLLVRRKSTRTRRKCSTRRMTTPRRTSPSSSGSSLPENGMCRPDFPAERRTFFFSCFVFVVRIHYL